MVDQPANPNAPVDHYEVVGGQLGLSGEQVGALKNLYHIASKALQNYVDLAPLAGPAGIAVAVAANILTLFGEDGDTKSDLEMALAKIEQLFGELGKRIDELENAIVQMKIADIDTEADALSATIMRYLGEVPAKGRGPANSEYLAFGGDVAPRSSFLALQMMNNATYWHRRYIPEMVCDIVGSQRERYRPPAEGRPEVVWDYRRTLLTAMKVFQVRMAYLAAANTPYTDLDLREIDRMADFLIGVHDRIQRGIHLLEAPAVQQDSWVSGDWEYSVTANGFWQEAKRPCGAVDTIGGLAFKERFPLPQPRLPDGQNNFTTTLDPVREQGTGRRRFNKLFLAHSLRLRAKLEDAIGLPEVRDLIAQMRRVTGAIHAEAGTPSAVPSGIREIVSPSKETREQLARPLEWLGQKKPPVMLPFAVEWPSSARAFAAEWWKDFTPLDDKLVKASVVVARSPAEFVGLREIVMGA